MMGNITQPKVPIILEAEMTASDEVRPGDAKCVLGIDDKRKASWMQAKAS